MRGNVTFGEVTAFLTRMDNDMKEISRAEQDELCRKAGMPTVTEQQEYWNNKENADREKVNLLRAVDAMGVFLGEMNESTAKLRKEFEKLAKEYQPKDEDLSPA